MFQATSSSRSELVADDIREYARSKYDETGGVEIAILDCIGFLRHFLHLFHRLRKDFLDQYQVLFFVNRTARSVRLRKKHSSPYARRRRVRIEPRTSASAGWKTLTNYSGGFSGCGKFKVNSAPPPGGWWRRWFRRAPRTETLYDGQSESRCRQWARWGAELSRRKDARQPFGRGCLVRVRDAQHQSVALTIPGVPAGCDRRH